MKKTIYILIAIFSVVTSAMAGDIYVATTGCDTAAGTKAEPILTIEAALKQAREWRRLHRAEAKNGITVHVGGGTYYLEKPLFIRPEDSGSKLSPTIVCGDEGANVVVSGGTLISGWLRGCDDTRFPKAIRRQLWVADAPMCGNRIVYCRQLWVNGRKAVRAQQGKNGEMIRMNGFDAARRSITIPTPKENLNDARQLEMTVHQRWAIAILRVKSMIDLGNGLSEVKFLEPESSLEFSHPWPQPVIGGERGNSSFFLSNAPQLLDEPGEWYQDYPSGKIYYLPRDGEDMQKVEAVVPVLSNLVEVSGTRERTVHDIAFRNITFAHSAWTRPLNEGHVALQAGFGLIDAYKLSEPGLPEKASLENQAWIRRPDAAVSVRHSSGIDFSGCRFEHLAATGLDYSFAASRSTVDSCSFSDIGGSGIMVGHFPDKGFETHVPYAPVIPSDLCDSITISNNELSDIANEDWGCVGVNAGYVSNICISGNDLHQMNYSGICVGWGWTPRESGMHHNRILNNRVHDFARQLYDVGGIYTLSNQPHSVMSGNRIWDLHEAPYATNDRAFYIYFDEATDGYTVSDNWMPDKKRIGFNQPGKNLVIKEQ